MAYVDSRFIIACLVGFATACGSDTFDGSPSPTPDGGDGAAGSAGASGGSAGTGGGSGGSAGPGATGASGGGAGVAGMSGAGGVAGSAGMSGAAGAGGSGTLADGQPCVGGNECQSGHCTDSRCCDAACDGPCVACNLPNKVGTCSPHSANTDPEMDCIINGGVACAGTCDGSSACMFPGLMQTCGPNSCTGTTQSTPACDSMGSCNAMATKNCAPYRCGATACRTNCGSDNHCTPNNYCNNSSKCVAKKADGQGCGGDNECQNAHCVSGTCCATTCAAPNSCATGQCLCNGTACSAGATCINYYLDSDGDNYGNPAVPRLGCSNVTPPPPASGGQYVKNNTDCYDGNPAAHPGQTAYFDDDRGDGSFDYNCISGEEQRYGTSTFLTTCMSCVGGQICPSCGIGGQRYGYSCSGCNGVLTQTFKHAVACGSPDTLYSCAACGGESATPNKKQECR